MLSPCGKQELLPHQTICTIASGCGLWHPRCRKRSRRGDRGRYAVIVGNRLVQAIEDNPQQETTAVAAIVKELNQAVQTAV